MQWLIWLGSLAIVWAQADFGRVAVLDSMVKAYMAWQRHGGEMLIYAPTPTPIDPEEVEERLQALNPTIPLEVNPMSLQMIDLYLNKQPFLTAYLLGMADYYLPVIEPILRSYGLPSELQYLPVIESAFVPEALSPRAAAGIWQLIPSTGRLYGLRVDRYIDERYDLVKSTHAAARYLRDSYEMLGDWLLVIAAYNCGIGCVLRAIKMAGGRTNYWEIAPYLPIETRGYVPSFIAACYIMNYATSHGIQPIPPDIPREVDTVYCPVRTKLSVIASVAKVPLSWLKFYNPELRAEIVPPGYVLRVPAVAAYEVAEAIARLHSGQLVRQPVAQYRSKGPAFTWHIVRPGETIYTIARNYSVTPYQIIRWNQLWGYKVFPGMRLRIRPQSSAEEGEALEEWGMYMEGATTWKRSFIPVMPYIVPKFIPFRLDVSLIPPSVPTPSEVEPLPATRTRRRR